MTKNFKAVKASILTGIVLISVLFAVLPTASAGLIFNIQSALAVTWPGNQTDAPIVPRGALRSLDLQIVHTVTRGAFGRALLAFYNGAPVSITVQIIETPSWVTATLSQGSLQTQVVPDGSTILITQITLQVADNAPAYGVVRLTNAASG